MEEILASIRRIIADDDATKSTPRAAEGTQPAPAAPAAPVVPAAPVAPEAKPAPLIQSGPASSAAAVEQRPAEIKPKPSASAVESIFTSEAAEEASDVFDLTESMTSAEPAAPPSSKAEAVPQFRTIEGEADVAFDESSENSAAQANTDYVRRKPISERGDYGAPERVRLLSNETTAAVNSAFNSLAQTVLVHNARTLEDLVREMLRPMLKTWLDDNLPGVVERLVRAEIERVSRGRAG